MPKREVIIAELSRNHQSVRLIGSYADMPKETWCATVEVFEKQLLVRTKLHNDEKREGNGESVKIPEAIQEEMKNQARYALGLEKRPPIDGSLHQAELSVESLQLPLFGVNP